jgi:Na+/H+-dicarboxylate symporter
MPHANLSHFEATMLLALFISVVLGITTKSTDRERLRYGLRSFAWFLVTIFGLGWLMYLGHR